MIIQTDQLTKRYGRQKAVENLSLNLPEGCIYGLLGLNGAGKTTTLKLLVNLIAPSSGSAQVLGQTSTRLGIAEMRELLKQRAIATFALHLLTPEGRNNHARARAQFRPSR